MAATKYTYSISGDFPNQKVDLDRLTKEIDADATITTALSHIDTAGDDCDIWFVDALSAPEVTALDTVVANHGGEGYSTETNWVVEPVKTATTNRTAYMEYVRLSLTNVPTGDYFIHWAFQVGCSNYQGSVKFKVVLDGTTTLLEDTDLSCPLTWNKTAWIGGYIDHSYFSKQTDLPAGDHYVAILIASNAETYSASMRNARIEVVKIG